ncbi:MAG: hypothetical protein HOK97_06815 [Deltaproteobacteria bacterium]|jgi:hypothetical protein|nr:hypothetical protein [Deltaproteobacteria bacterium]MBT6489453.1 hypothetical protein [Deltaproteobacteria bacterium]
MKVQLDDGRIFEAIDAEGIVEKLFNAHKVGFSMMPEDIKSITGYVEWAAGNIRRVTGTRNLVIMGSSRKERCGALLDAAVAARQAAYLHP